MITPEPSDTSSPGSAQPSWRAETLRQTEQKLGPLPAVEGVGVIWMLMFQTAKAKAAMAARAMATMARLDMRGERNRSLASARSRLRCRLPLSTLRPGLGGSAPGARPTH